jgi:uncharacterized phage infection (PIP) family protein YhgE
MSTSGVTPSLSNFSPKSFWSKPEGKPGMILMAALAAAGAYGLYIALPFLIALTTNLIELGVLVGVLVGMIALVMNGTVQTLAKNIFQSVCRGIAMAYTTIDPIGILRNQLDDMVKAKRDLETTIQKFSGSDNKLTAKIAAKTQLIQQLIAKANELRSRLAQGKAKNNDEAETWKLQAETWESQAGLENSGMEQLQNLEATTAQMLDKFRHWSRVSDAKIDRMKIKVDFYAAQREAILEAQKVLSIGARLLKGDNEQLRLVDGAIDFLTDEASRTVGEINEFNRESDKMLLDIDVENSANAAVARAKFENFGAKLEEDSNKPSAVQQLEAALAATGKVPAIPGKPVVGVGTAASGSGVGSGDYNDLFRKN